MRAPLINNSRGCNLLSFFVLVLQKPVPDRCERGLVTAPSDLSVTSFAWCALPWVFQIACTPMWGRDAWGKSFSSYGACAPGQSTALASAPCSSNLCNSGGLSCAAVAGHQQLLPSDLMTGDKLCPGTKAALSSALSFADGTCCRKNHCWSCTLCSGYRSQAKAGSRGTTRLVRSGVMCFQWVSKALACAGVQGREGLWWGHSEGKRHGLGSCICWGADGAAGMVGKLVEGENKFVQEGRGRKTEVHPCLCVS